MLPPRQPRVFARLTRWQLVYVIGLHAVQFGNNWMRKIPRTAKLDEAVGRVQFGSPRNFLNPIISKFDKHVVLLPINYRASENFFFCFVFFVVQSLFKAKLNVRAKTIQFILNWTVQKKCYSKFVHVFGIKS